MNLIYKGSGSYTYNGTRFLSGVATACDEESAEYLTGLELPDGEDAFVIAEQSSDGSQGSSSKKPEKKPEKKSAKKPEKKPAKKPATKKNVNIKKADL